MDRKHFRGIAIGASIFVLAANLFQFFLGWEIMAVFTGLIIGLEAGFWSWNPKATIECQKEYLGSAMYSCWGILREIGSALSEKILELLNILMYVGVASAAIWWCSIFSMDSWPLLSLIPSLDIFKELPPPWLGYLGVGIGAMLIQAQIIKEIEFDNYGHRRERPWPKAVFWRVMPLSLNVLLSPLSIPLSGVVLGLFAAWLIGGLAIYAPMLALLELGRRQQLVPAGIILGGLCGLAYGWTSLAPGMTALAMITAAAAGLLSAWLISELVKSKKFFKAVVEIADWIPFADGPKPMRKSKAR